MSLEKFQPDPQRALRLKNDICSELFESLNHIYEKLDQSSLVRSDKIFEQLSAINSKSNRPVPELFLINSALLEDIENNLSDNLTAYEDFLGSLTPASSEIKMSLLDSGTSRELISLISRFTGHQTIKAAKNLNEYIKISQIALTQLKNIDRECFEELNIFTSKIWFMNDPSTICSTSFHSFGAIYINPSLVKAEWYDIADKLVHEAAHLHVYALARKDLLVLNSSEKRYSSPLRPDKRPLDGIYHQCFVLARLVRFHRAAIGTDCLSNPDEGKTMYSEYLERLKFAINVLRKHAELTDLGKTIVDSIEGECLEG